MNVLLGIGYNSLTEQNFLESIDPGTGKATTLNSFTFDTGSWTSGTFVATSTDAFAVSSDGLLYDFDATTGNIKSTTSIGTVQALAADGSSLLGIGYNSLTEQNFLESIDPGTGKATTLNSFTFDTGSWTSGTFVATSTDAFAVSSDGLLYDFDATTGNIKSTTSIGTVQALAADGSSLLGIGYNSLTEQNFLESIDPGTGKATTLNSFTFDTGSWTSGTFVATSTDAFAVSSDGLLYDFDATTGTLKSTALIGTVQALAAPPQANQPPVSSSDALFFSDLAYHGFDPGTWYSDQLTTYGYSNTWSFLRESSAGDDQSDSYFGVAFKNTNTGEIVVANRGSVDAIDWGISDRAILHETSPLPSAFTDALDFANSLGGNIFETGHSLGGAEAQYVAAELGVTGTTFAAPGMQWAVPGKTADVIGYSFAGELIGNLNTPIGSRQALFPNGITQYHNAAVSLAIDDAALTLGFPFSLIPDLDPLSLLHGIGNYLENFGLNVPTFGSADTNITPINPVPDGILLTLGPFEPKSTLPVTLGSAATISTDFLYSFDPIYSDAQLTYSILTQPSHGTIFDKGIATRTFTEADIDNHLVQYQENGDIVTADSFTFVLFDPRGNHTPIETFNIAIEPASEFRSASYDSIGDQVLGNRASSTNASSGLLPVPQTRS